MVFLIILALLVCVVALVLTLIAVGQVDSNYNMNSSFRNLTVIYMVVLPIIGALIVIAWLIFR